MTKREKEPSPPGIRPCGDGLSHFPASAVLDPRIGSEEPTPDRTACAATDCTACTTADRTVHAATDCSACVGADVRHGHAGAFEGSANVTGRVHLCSTDGEDLIADSKAGFSRRTAGQDINHLDDPVRLLAEADCQLRPCAGPAEHVSVSCKRGRRTHRVAAQPPERYAVVAQPPPASPGFSTAAAISSNPLAIGKAVATTSGVGKLPSAQKGGSKA